MNRITIAGSLIGSIAETQEVLDFAAEHGIAAEVKVIPVQQVNETFDEMVGNDIRFRFVMDTSTLDADRDRAEELPVSQ